MTHSRTFPEHLQHLRLVFERLSAANLKLKASKCVFAMNCTKFLGFDISNKGIVPSSDKFDAIKNYPAPKTAKQVKRFLGLASYYRKFIHRYTRLADPINKLLKKDTKFFWSEELKVKLINPPILVYPDFRKQFILTTDASGGGLGAILSQLSDDDEIKHVVGYASRCVKDAETRYPAIELEAMAVKWAIEHFRHYLYNTDFLVYTDHEPLEAAMKADGMKTKRLAKWRQELADYIY